MAEANNRGTTTHVTDIELDAELWTKLKQ
jgi:hypothetical protein